MSNNNDKEKAVPKKLEAKSAGSSGAKTVEIMESAKKIATQREKIGKEVGCTKLKRSDDNKMSDTVF